MSATIAASTPTAAAPTTSAPAPTPTASVAPAPTPGPTTSAAPTLAPDPTLAPYCAVADVVTPIADYGRHVETYVDRTYRLPDGYAPTDMVSALTGARAIPAPFAIEAPRAVDLLLRRGDPSYTELLRDDATALVRAMVHPDLQALRDAATAAGAPVVILSAYRSYARQVATFDYWVRVSGYDRALTASARPGHSEHQLGTTIDFGDGNAAPWEYADWAATPAGGWLRDHAHEFGFVMSYPRGASDRTCYDYEPWHYRWVGRDLARTIVAAGVPLRVFQTMR